MNDQDIRPEDILKNEAARTTKIGRYAQVVLVLFAIASIIAGWSGDKLATIVLTVVIVIGFAFSVSRDWRARGADITPALRWFLLALQLVAVTTLFLSVLSYIGLGYPVALDRFFGRVPAAAPKASIELRGLQADTIVVRIEPYSDAKARIEAVTYPRGDSRPVGTPIVVDAMTDMFAIRNLKPGTAYTIRLTALADYRRSLSRDLQQATLSPAAKVADMTADKYPFYRAFFEELKRLGYFEGQNLVLERYSGEGQRERYADLARDVVNTRPDLILAPTAH